MLGVWTKLLFSFPLKEDLIVSGPQILPPSLNNISPARKTCTILNALPPYMFLH